MLNSFRNAFQFTSQIQFLLLKTRNWILILKLKIKKISGILIQICGKFSLKHKLK